SGPAWHLCPSCSPFRACTCGAPIFEDDFLRKGVNSSRISGRRQAAAEFRPTRRELLALCAGGAALGTLPHFAVADEPPRDSTETRGVVLVPEDLSLADWPERAKNAGLTTIGIHHQNSPQAVIRWIKTDAGQRFLEQCRKLDLAVEYELHAMREL